MLFCTTSQSQQATLFKLLGLPEVGDEIYFNMHVHNNGHWHFLVLEPNVSLRQQIDQARKYLKLTSAVLVFHSGFKEAKLDEFTICSVCDLERFLLLDQPTKNKLAVQFFGAAYQPRRIQTGACCICLTNSSTLTLGCGHQCLCEQCGKEWLDIKNECPLCKKKL